MGKLDLDNFSTEAPFSWVTLGCVKLIKKMNQYRGIQGIKLEWILYLANMTAQ